MKVIDIEDILGTDYQLIASNERENLKLQNNDGIAELYSKKLIFDFTDKVDNLTFENIESYMQSVVRHEMMHAFFHEAGLDRYADDEVLVDFIAKQFPKLQELFKTDKIVKITKEIWDASKKD